MAGLTQKGFEGKNLADVSDELNSASKLALGDTLDTSLASPQGQFNGIVGGMLAELWEGLVDLYASWNPTLATGVALSNLVRLNGITRNKERKTRLNLKFVVNSQTTRILSGIKVQDTLGRQYVITHVAPVVTPIAGTENFTTTAQALALKAGSTNPVAGTVNRLVGELAGFVSVTNTATSGIVVGRLEETDVALRLRRELSVALPAQSVIGGMYARVANVLGVISVYIRENDTNSTDSEGLPAHSFQVIVRGGDDDEVANAIHLTRPIGIASYGDTLKLVPNAQGQTYPVRFHRPTPLTIYASLRVDLHTGFPSGGFALLKEALVNGVASATIGNTLYASRFFASASEIEGVSLTAFAFLGTGASPTTRVDIPIPDDNYIVLSATNILITENT